jgi:LysM repeat protein
MVIADGDTLSGIAARTGVSVTDLVAANCLTDASSIISGQTLRVPVVPAGASSGETNGTGNGANSGVTPADNGASAANNCQGGNTWFFTFAFGGSDSGCPGPVTTVNAVGQNFQGGRVYRYDAAPGEQQALIYVIYNDGTWTAYPDTWDQSQPADDPSITPPQGWYKPTGALGKLWRDQPGVRAKLGWAYGPEDTFQGRRQTSSIPGYTYVDHGFRQYVVQLSQAVRTWRVVGYYQ